MNAAAAYATPLNPPLRTADRLVNGLLFLTILSSFFVRIEPAPYEGLFALLALACVAANVPIDRRLLPLIALLVAWNVGGLFSLTQVSTDPDAVTFVAVSIYLAVSAVLFACIFSEHILRRLALLKTAYVLAAIIVTLIGLAGYFVLDGRDAEIGRVLGTFKDPNVFGPFLILPMFLLIADLLQRGFSLWRIVVVGVLFFGLLMSFSRGAWLNFMAGGAMLALLLFLTAPAPSVRIRIVAMTTAALVLLAGVIIVALSTDTVGEMLTHRAQITQDYDVGDRGRFTTQALTIQLILENPNGVGPLQVEQYTRLAPHQVFLNAFASYGWLGGFSYLALIVATLVLGFRASLIRAPWATSLVCAYAAFFGNVAEGFVVDTDHWRHFYLVLGLVWGLSIASTKMLQPAPAETVRPAPARPFYRLLTSKPAGLAGAARHRAYE